MKLQEIIDQLCSVEFSQLALGKELLINPSPLVPQLNLGLTALYKRFLLKEDEIILQPVAGRTIYPLLSAYAISNADSSVPDKYLLDTQDKPFIDDVMQVESVWTEDGIELPLNDPATIYSLKTPTLTSLWLPESLVNQAIDWPEPYQTERLKVVYRAAHPRLEIATTSPETEIELPYSHLMALLYFLASRVHNPIGMVNEFHAGNSYAAKYEQECKELELTGLEVVFQAQNSRLERAGWV